MNLNRTSCNHTSSIHFFEKPFCKNQTRIKRISLLAFHIFTAFIPYIVCKFVKKCCHKKPSTPLIPTKPINEDNPTKFIPHSDDLVDLFGGQRKINELPYFDLKDFPFSVTDKPFYEVLEQLTKNAFFKDLPPIFRLHLNWEGRGFQDIIILKYSLFVAEETLGKFPVYDKYSIKRERDYVLHDWLCIFHGYNNWRITDSRDDDYLSQTNSDYSFPYAFSYRHIFTPQIKDCEKKLTQLIENKPVGIFNGYPHVPNFIEKDWYGRRSDRSRVFRDIPIMLGHAKLDDFYANFRVEHNPDFVILSDNTIDDQNNQAKPERVIFF